MKKTFYLIMVAVLSAALFASCNKIEEEEVVTPDDPQIEQPAVVETLTFAIQGDEATKAVLGGTDKKHGEWETGDKIGYIVNGKTSDGNATVTLPVPATFSVSCSEGFAVGDKVYAWFPYGEKQTNPAAVPMSIPTAQTMKGASFDFSAMPMVAEEISVTQGMIDAGGSTTIDFFNLGSLIDFKIFAVSSYTTEKIVSVTFEASGNIAGNFSKDMTDAANLLSVSGNTGTSITTRFLVDYCGASKVGSPDAANACDVYMVVAPGSYSGSIIVETDAATYTWALSSKEFQRSHVRSFGLQLDKASGVTRVPHVKGSFAWDLTKVSYDSAAPASVTWSHGFLTMTNSRNGGTAANNRIPSSYEETRFYSGNILSFTPGSMQIEKVVFSGNTYGGVNNLVNSTWTNASASSDGTSVTIIPTDGSAVFSGVMAGGTGWQTATVYYDNNTYTIAKGSEVNGTFTVSAATAKVNTTIALNATPSPGYYLSAWSVTASTPGDVSVDGNSFQMPAHNVTVDATFALGGYAISIPDPSNGSVSTSPATSATAGTEVTITTTPDEGYYLWSISVIDSESNVVAVSENKFIMPDKAVTITATFARVNTVLFNSETNSSGTNKYVDNSFDTTSDYITVTCKGVSNNNNGWDYIKIGKAREDSDPNPLITTGTITTKSALSNAINKVIVTMSKEVASGSATAILYVASDSEFTDDLQTINLGTVTDSNGDKEFSIVSPSKNRYYKLEFECSNPTKTNGVIKVTKVQYYQDPTVL